MTKVKTAALKVLFGMVFLYVGLKYLFILFAIRIIHGATLFEVVEEIRRERARREELMVLLLFGSFLGVPVIPTYPALRLIPHTIPHLGIWRCRMLREKDFTELLDHELG